MSVVVCILLWIPNTNNNLDHIIVSFHNVYSIWEAFGKALGSFQELRRPTFGVEMEVRRQVPLVLRAIFQHQAPHHLSNVPP